MSVKTVGCDLEVLNAFRTDFSIMDIGNRRFMYCAPTGTLILGAEECGADISLSHAQEHMLAGVDEPYDAFVRGWIGVGKRYKNGVIHFAPNVSTHSPYFDAAFFALKMFKENGAIGKTVIRGFGDVWEQPLSRIFP